MSDPESKTAVIPWTLIDQLSKASGVIGVGRKYGIYVTATADAIDAIRQSGHRDAEFIANNLCPIGVDPWSVKYG